MNDIAGCANEGPQNSNTTTTTNLSNTENQTPNTNAATNEVDAKAKASRLDEQRALALHLIDIVGLQPQPWIVSDVVRTLTLCTSDAMRHRGQAERSAHLYKSYCSSQGRQATVFGLTRWLLNDDASNQGAPPTKPINKSRARCVKLEAEQRALHEEYDKATQKPIEERTSEEQRHIDELKIRIGRNAERLRIAMRESH